MTRCMSHDWWVWWDSIDANGLDGRRPAVDSRRRGPCGKTRREGRRAGFSTRRGDARGRTRARARGVDRFTSITWIDFSINRDGGRAARSSIDARERSRGRRRRAWTGVVDRVARTRARARGRAGIGRRGVMAAAGAASSSSRRARASARGGGEGDDARRGSKAWVTSLAGAIAGASARVRGAVGCGEDRLQVQLEAGAAGKYRGLTHAVSTILREEGVRAMWAGTTPALLLWVPYTAIQFTVLNAFKDAADEWERARPGSTRGVPMNFIGGAVAGSAATVVTYPFDVIRTLLASQGHPKVYKGILDAPRASRASEASRAACTRASR